IPDASSPTSQVSTRSTTNEHTKSFRIRSYAKCAHNPFRIRSYDLHGGWGAYCKLFSISATGIAPSLSTFHSSPCSSTIVDGSAAPVSPPSNTRGKRLPSCLITWSAPEHEGNPDTFALVPVIGPSNSSISCVTTSLRGQRSATRPVP